MIWLQLYQITPPHDVGGRDVGPGYIQMVEVFEKVTKLPNWEHTDMQVSARTSLFVWDAESQMYVASSHHPALYLHLA